MNNSKNLNFDQLPTEIHRLIYSYNKPHIVYKNLVKDFNERIKKGNPNEIMDEEDKQQELDWGVAWTWFLENSEEWDNPWYCEINEGFYPPF